MSERTTKRAQPKAPPANGNGHHGAEGQPLLPDPAPNLGMEVEVVKLRLRDLNSAGEAYQRPVDMPYVQYLKDNWDWDAARVLLVNQRPDGGLWLVDGQHRGLAMQDLFGDIEVWSYLVHLPGAAEEAELYERVSDGHSKPSALVLFRGRLTRKEPVAVDIDRIVTEEGFGLALVGKPESEFQLTIPAVLNGIYKKAGPERLRDVLAFCRDTWRGQPGFASSHTVTGVAKFFEYFAWSPAWDRDNIVQVLSRFPLEDVGREGKKVIGELGYHRHVALAVAMQQLYNAAVKGRNTKLYRKKEQ
jgi:hypothetical protein